MSRRDYNRYDYDYDDRDRARSRNPARRDRDRNEIDIDIRESHSRGPQRRSETVVLERDRRDERRQRLPDFLREDHGKSAETQLVIRDGVRDDDDRSRLTSRRRSNESLARSRVRDRTVDKEEIIIRERDRRPPYPPSDIGRRGVEDEEVVFRERARSRAPPSSSSQGAKEEIDISIRRRDDDERSVAPPRNEVRERDVEEITIRRGEGERRLPRREVVEEEEIKIRETRSSPPRRGPREESREEIDIRIRETDRSGPPRPRSHSRGHIVATEKEEWVVRRPRREPSPPPRDYEKEEIIIRRRERSITPEPPPREPSPDPMPPPLEPIVRPPIVQEVITHYRNIDHGFERAREPTPPLPPPSPPREREEDLEIAIRRTGTRNGKAYDEELIIEQDRREREDTRVVRRAPSVVSSGRRRAEEDETSSEADYYNRRVASRAYPGEAYNGATRKWELVDIPPGTERVRMDGIGGGAQEITWQRYNGERTSKFYADGRVHEHDLERRAPAPSIGRGEEKVEETRIERRTTIEERPLERQKTKDRMWTEVTKDLVIKEAIVESGYEYEETDEFYYVMEYLRYEDVLKLVELTEDIRRERRERIREIQWEREEIERAPKLLPAPLPPPPVPAPPRSFYDERIYEREYIYDRDGRRYRRG